MLRFVIYSENVGIHKTYCQAVQSKLWGVRQSQQETVKCSDYFLLKAPVLNKSDFEEFGVYFLGVSVGKRLYLRQWGKEEGVS